MLKIYLPGPDNLEHNLQLLESYQNDLGYTVKCYDDEGLLDALVVLYKDVRIASLTFGSCSPLSAIDGRLSFQRFQGFHRIMKYDGSVWTKYNVPDGWFGEFNLERLMEGYTTDIKTMSKDKPGHRWKRVGKVFATDFSIHLDPCYLA